MKLALLNDLSVLVNHPANFGQTRFYDFIYDENTSKVEG